MKIKRGDIFFADLSPVLGSEIGGLRYVVIVSNDELNEEASSNGGTVIVAPLSSSSVETGSHTKATIVCNHSRIGSFLVSNSAFGNKSNLRESIR